MRNMIKVTLVLFALLLGVNQARAEDMDQIICNDCASGKLLAQARDLGNGNHYFWDFSRRQLTHYLVQGIAVPMSVPARSGVAQPLLANSNGTVTLVPLTSDEQHMYGLVQALYDRAGTINITKGTSISLGLNEALVAAASRQAMLAGISRVEGTGSNASSGHPVSAFDIVSSKLLQDQAIQKATNPGMLSDPLSQMEINFRTNLTDIANFATISGVKTPVTLQISVSLEDGSSFTTYFDFATQTWKYQVGSARDAAGNHIPQNLSDVTNSGGVGKYYYTGADGWGAGVQMTNYLNSMGATVRYGAGVKINDGYVIACTGVGGQIQCVVEPLPG